MSSVVLLPDVQIGVDENGNPYYAKDLAQVLYEFTERQQWELMDEVAKNFIHLAQKRVGDAD